MFGAPLQSPNEQVCGMGGDMQVPCFGYWAAVSIIKGLNWGRGSACGPSDPPAQVQVNFFGVYRLTFLSHNPQDLEEI